MVFYDGEFPLNYLTNQNISASVAIVDRHTDVKSGREREVERASTKNITASRIIVNRLILRLTHELRFVKLDRWKLYMKQ